MLTKRNLLEMRIRRSRIGTAKYRRNDQYERRKDFSRKKVRGRAADMHQICFVVYRSMWKQEWEKQDWDIRPSTVLRISTTKKWAGKTM